jgi:excisionase family DNA binding protein
MDVKNIEPIEPVLLRPLQAARMLSVSRSRVYEMLRSGSLPAVRLDGRTWRIPRAALEKLAADAMQSSTILLAERLR